MFYLSRVFLIFATIVLSGCLGRGLTSGVEEIPEEKIYSVAEFSELTGNVQGVYVVGALSRGELGSRMRQIYDIGKFDDIEELSTCSISREQDPIWELETEGKIKKLSKKYYPVILYGDIVISNFETSYKGAVLNHQNEPIFRTKRYLEFLKIECS